MRTLYVLLLIAMLSLFVGCTFNVDDDNEPDVNINVDNRTVVNNEYIDNRTTINNNDDDDDRYIIGSNTTVIIP